MSLLLAPLLIAQSIVMLFAALYAWGEYGMAGGFFGLLASAAATTPLIGLFQHRVVKLVARDA